MTKEDERMQKLLTALLDADWEFVIAARIAKGLVLGKWLDEKTESLLKVIEQKECLPC